MPRNPRTQLSASRRYALTTAPFVIAAAALCNWVVWPHVGYLHAMQRLEPVMLYGGFSELGSGLFLQVFHIEKIVED